MYHKYECNDNEEKGPEVSKMFDVVSDYRYIFISRNYVFYRIEDLKFHLRYIE